MRIASRHGAMEAAGRAQTWRARHANKAAAPPTTPKLLWLASFPVAHCSIERVVLVVEARREYGFQDQGSSDGSSCPVTLIEDTLLSPRHIRPHLEGEGTKGYFLNF